MSEELKYKLFNPTDCLSEQTMYAYIDDKLSPKEQHIVEKHLLECELCSDAMEGLRLVKNRSITATINNEVSERMALPLVAEEKAQRFSYRTLIAVAAVLLLLIGGVSLFNHFSSQEPNGSGMAELKPVENEKAKQPVFETNAIDTVVTKNATPPVTQQASGAATQPKGNLRTTTTGSDAFVATKHESFGEAQTESAEQAPVTADEAPAPPAMPDNVAVQKKQNKAVNGDLDYEKAVKDQGKADKLEDGFQNDLDNKSELEEVVVTSNSRGRKESKNAERKIASNKDLEQSLALTPGVQSTTAAPASTNSTTFTLSATPSGSGVTAGTYQWSAADSTKVSLKTDTALHSVAGLSQGYFNYTTTSPFTPQYPGGYIALLQFIDKNAKWPVLGNKESISSSKIITQFTIDANGNVINPKIIKGINAAYDAEALRVIKLMPRWVPATKNGKAVDFLYTLPIQVEIK